MLLLADVRNQNSIVLAPSPIAELATAQDITTNNTATPTVATVTINKFTMMMGSTNKLSLPDAALAAEDDSVRIHNGKNFNMLVYLVDGTTKLDTIPQGTEKTYLVSGGKWIKS